MRTVRRQCATAVLLQVAVLNMLAAAFGLAPLGWVVGLMCGLGTSTGMALGHRRDGATSFGPADQVTLLRATFVGGVAALVADQLLTPAPTTVVIVVLAAMVLVLDNVDGRVARRTATVTSFGARFDMEVDAFLILVLSFEAAASAGSWVLVIGAMRYAMGAAGALLPWLRTPVPPRYWRKVVAAVQGVTLTVVVSGVMPHRATDAVLGVALALLVESFGRDVIWLRRVHSRPRSASVADSRRPVGLAGR